MIYNKKLFFCKILIIFPLQEGIWEANNLSLTEHPLNRWNASLEIVDIVSKNNQTVTHILEGYF